MEQFNLNLIPGGTRPVCHASQYDIGRTVRINLFEGTSVFTLTGAETISLSVRKPDGNVVTAAVTNTSDSYVEIETTEQMTACHGSNLCELKLEEGGDVIGTLNFILEVEQDPLEGGVQSASEIDNLQTQVAGMVATEVADQYDSANVIFDASPVPGHGNGYAVTSEGVATELALKQDATDANLQTTDTTIVGAINELNSNKADAANTYTKTEVDNALAGKQSTLLQYNGSATTDSVGFFSHQFPGAPNYKVISAWADQGDCIVIPFARTGINTDGTYMWWFKVCDQNLQPRTNYNISIHFLYI